ncbi:hypothetical protein [Spirosoma utsteinense]|uniref:hypothetical protein n=1 Tax=Spirosoma utsteinense TaxID=2585773 RepID=UPI00164810D0|nr:hypothetical protein [Spirosoma utsteinense]MBC3787759.1 hypothetical protein [Spirosoma utsteinense]
MNTYRVLLIGLLLVGLSCRHGEPTPGVGSTRLIGTRLLFETGNSPGFGYFITPIPPTPPQTITFTTDGGLKVQGDALGYYQRIQAYRFDSTQYGLRLSLFTDSNSQPIYNGFQLHGDTLRLIPTCYEGCHYEFLRNR